MFVKSTENVILDEMPGAPRRGRSAGTGTLTEMEDVEFAWRGDFTDPALNALHAEAFGHTLLDDDWRSQVERHSLGWVTAHDTEGLVGFVNVPWDGAIHAWIQDTLVASRRRHEGVATRLIEVATAHARQAGCEWLHVDFDDELRPFYFDACGFEPTDAGLIKLF